MAKIENITFMAALAAYLVSAALYFVYIAVKNEKVSKAASPR